MKKVLHILLFLSVAACASLESPERSLVVEAYIYENQPVENIKLNLVDEINGSGSSDIVANVDVFISNNGIKHTLSPQLDGTFKADSTLQIQEGEQYELMVLYNDLEITAETQVPISPEQLVANKDTLYTNNASDFILITWHNPDSLWFLGVISEIDTEVQEFPFNNFFSIPTRGNKLEVSSNNVNIKGKANFILYGITEEYQKLYRISSSTIGSTNAGNLSNGFGIFAAFSSDTLAIYIKNE